MLARATENAVAGHMWPCLCCFVLTCLCCFVRNLCCCWRYFPFSMLVLTESNPRHQKNGVSCLLERKQVF